MTCSGAMEEDRCREVLECGAGSHAMASEVWGANEANNKSLSKQEDDDTDEVYGNSCSTNRTCLETKALRSNKSNHMNTL